MLDSVDAPVAVRPGGAPLAGGRDSKYAPAGKPCCYGTLFDKDICEHA